jgi:uroporphyrinogen III methyltransferase/synthase
VSKGKVFLVGAGPGDPGLITVKGLQCMEAADVVVYDRLVDRRILGRAAPDAEMIDVGKVPGRGGSKQADINSLLVQKANQGNRVVRLKGGDSFVFGRGGEEADTLQQEGIAFEVVPGVTSAVAAPAYAGIPLTHRGLSSSFTVVTGTEMPGKDASSVDWEALAKQPGTLVVLMGWENLPAIVEGLLRHGKEPQTPVALVRWGTEPYQETVVGTLSDIVTRAADSGLKPPVVAVIGQVVQLRDRLRWFDNQPLFGKRILVTRTRSQAGVLSKLLAERGAQAIELPTIEIGPIDDYRELDDALRDLGRYEWVVFSSTNAVQAVFDRLQVVGLDTRAFHGARVAAIGSTTADRLAERGIAADFVPDELVSEAMVDGLRRHGLEGRRVLLPNADIARKALATGLSELGATVDEVAVYRTSPADGVEARLQDVIADGIDVATFTSSSTATNLVSLLDGSVDRLSEATIACIGPITAATARELGLKVDIIASEHTISGLVDALEAHFAGEESPRE